jgi:hypothetical protein
VAVRGITLSVALLLVLLTAACGDSRSAARRAMDNKFEQIDFQMASIETLNSGFDPHLAKFSHQYIALIRKYAPQLGRNEARHRLEQKGDEVGPYCLPCKAIFEDEARRY